MKGFLLLGGLYAAAWAALLVSGAFVTFGRARGLPLPSDDVSDTAWIQHVQTRLLARVGDAVVDPGQVPFEAAVSRRRASLSDDAIRVTGDVVVPEAAQVPVGMLVDGDVICGAGSVLSGAVWAAGSIRTAEDVRALGHVVAANTLTLGPRTHVEGGAAAAGDVVLESGAVVDGAATSLTVIELHEGSRVASALAPVVRGAPIDPALEVEPRLEAEPLRDVEWTPELDDALRSLWPQGRLAEIVHALHERTGVVVRGVFLMRRARDLGLFEQGLPKRPAVLGRKPAWVVTPETVRVGADLRVPPGGTVSYALAVEGALEVFQNAELEASARSGRGMLLRSGSVLYGAAASDGLIVCEEGTAILGPVDSSTHILLFANARAGVPGFGGAHALGAIGLEPGAEIVGGAVAGHGVRGEALRPEPERAEASKAVPKVKRKDARALAELEDTGELPQARGGRRRARKRSKAAPEAEVDELPADDAP